MLLSYFSSLSPPGTVIWNRRRHPHYHRSNCSPCSSSSAVTCQLEVGFQEIATIAENKVLVAAVVSTAVGQLSKPFTSAFVYGNAFEVKAAVQSGGFPSTHSSAVVAAATSLCLERGFSDSIFGLTVVYAALVMYDAQGVRREVGKHARTINRVLHERKHSQKDTISVNLKDEEEITSGEQTNATEGIEDTHQSHPILYERVGHTEIETMAHEQNPMSIGSNPDTGEHDDGASSSRGGRGGRKKFSWVWNYLSIKDPYEPQEGRMAVCVVCLQANKRREFAYTSGTGAFTQHLAKSHNIKAPDVEAIPEGQAQISGYATPDLGTFVYNRDRMIDGIF